NRRYFAWRGELLRVGARLGTHQNIESIQLLLEANAQWRHTCQSLLQQRLCLCNLPPLSCARVVTSVHETQKMLIDVDLVLSDGESRLIAADLKVSVCCVSHHAHARPESIRLSGLRFCSRG